MKKRICFLYEFIRKDIALTITGLALSLLNIILFLVPPQATRYLFDNVLPMKDKNIQLVIMCAIAFFAAFFIAALCFFLKGWVLAKVSENCGKRLRERIYDNILNLPYEYHIKHNAGDLLQRCTSDVEMVQNFMGNQLVEILSSVFILVSVTAVVFNMHLGFGIISIFAFPFVFVGSYFLFKRAMPLFEKYENVEAVLTTNVQEMVRGVQVIKAFGAQKYEEKHFVEKNENLFNAGMKVSKIMALFWSASDFLCLFQFAVSVCVGSVMCINSSLSIGVFTSVLSYLMMLFWPVRHLGQLFALAGQTFIAVDRLNEVLNAESEYQEQMLKKPQIKGNIKFENVKVAFDEDAPIFDGLSFEIKSGETIAILGATGSGKSTIANLLIRLREYQSGSIKIDGVELKEIDKKWIRENISVALQTPFLFTRTLRDNIRFGDFCANENEIIAATKIAAIHRTIKGMENGYDTIIGERGVNLSGGQRQRLSIARTILKEVPILVFDDSLSAVDTETDAQIRSELAKRNKDCTTIIISHRITTLADADRIFVLGDKAIIQEGTHDELVNVEGPYREVCEMQGYFDKGEVENG